MENKIANFDCIESMAIDYFKRSSALSKDKLIDEIFNFEDKFLDKFSAAKENAENLPLNHVFCNHQYAREIFLEKGLIASGRVHKFDHISVISKGKVAVLSSTDGLVFYQAPITFSSKAGTKRIVLSLEDTHWTTIHTTDTKDINILFDEMTCNSKDFCKLMGDR